jgi:hypothetical protein
LSSAEGVSSHSDDDCKRDDIETRVCEAWRDLYLRGHEHSCDEQFYKRRKEEGAENELKEGHREEESDNAEKADEE